MDDARSWQVLLLGGASGVGKTHVSYPLARYFDVGFTSADDISTVLERMTDRSSIPSCTSGGCMQKRSCGSMMWACSPIRSRTAP